MSDLPIPVFVEGCPKHIIERAEFARSWLKAARALSEQTPDDAPDRELVKTNLKAAMRESQDARCLLTEFRKPNP